MVEVVAAVGGAVLTACFLSVGSISFRSRQSRDDFIRLTTAMESVEKRIESVHTDVKDIYCRLNHVDRAVANLQARQIQ